ncbi:MAG: response regulator transcription factor [Anaerolineales bacterium]|nr:response regulator transcription factor [Anaerolineales bacterium]
MMRLLIADDHPVVRDGLAAMLGTQPDFEVVGMAATGREVVAQATALRPDMVLLDLEMPDMDGVEALRQLAVRCPEVRALVFTAFDTDERIVGAVQAGAHGYLLKGAPREELFNAIRVVGRGGSLLQPVVASKLIRRMAQPPAEPAADPLTERELEVLRLLAQGKANKEIAAALHISERTVKFHVSAIFTRLGAGNRTEAARFAVQRGLIEL